MNTKQVIVIRKDLEMRKGKMASQAAHASMKVFFDRGVVEFSDQKDSDGMLKVPLSEAMGNWTLNAFTKIVVGVESEEELGEVYLEAQEADLPCSMIRDAGLTEFDEPTLTAVAVGPAEGTEVDEITGDLPLL